MNRDPARLPLFLVAFLLTISLTIGRARAEGRRVAVVNGDPVLVEALSQALSPWGLSVSLATVPDPAPDMARGIVQAREVTASAPADAVVWITSLAGGGASDSLWIYDASTEQIVVRALSVPAPFDEATAAAIALSVKTLLRSTTIAPPPEQLAPPGPRTEVPPVTAGPHRLDPQPTMAAPASHLRLEAALGLRVLTGDGVRFEPRPSLALSFWPATFDARFGVALGVAAGPGLSVDRGTFTGTYSDTNLSAAVRARLPAGPLALELAVGPSAHFTRIRGDLGTPSVRTGASRVDPSLDAGATLLFRLSPRVDLGVALGAAFFLRYQGYFADARPVFALSPLEPSTALRLAVTLN